MGPHGCDESTTPSHRPCLHAPRPFLARGGRLRQIPIGFQGEAEQEGGSVGDAGIKGQSTAEAAAEASAQGKAEADAGHAAGGGGRRPAERLEKAAGRFLGETGAVVAEAQGGEAG